jgi:[ribosomal protein S5]-alanine N-acetyltransferase
LSNSDDYFLRTPRLRFRCWREDDSPLAWALWGDPRVVVFLGGPFTADQVQARLNNEMAMMREHKVQYWPVFSREDGELAGCAGLRPYKNFLELGFHFRPGYWGRGLAQEAAQAVIAFAFGTLGVESLFAGHHPANVASERLLRKLGFQFARQEFYPPSGLVEPTYLLMNPRLT